MVAASLGALFCAFLILNFRNWDFGLATTFWRMATRMPNSMLFYIVVLSASQFAVLRWRKLNSRALAVFDLLFLESMIGPILLLFGQFPWFSFSGYSAVVPFLVLILFARAILLPSTALWTALISAPAPLGVLWLQLRAGATYALPDQAYSATHFTDTLVQNQVMLWSTVLIAAAASRIHLGLRRERFDAKRLGQYHIDRPLGQGAMGEVYLATHALLKRPTAIKLLRVGMTGSDTLKRFEREVRASSRLSHPNSILIYDYGHTADGTFYYAMEYLHGADLRRVVNTIGPMSPARVIHVLAHACGALSEAHELGLIHRDIKPENLMLCVMGGEHDVVKLLDFGLVHELSQETQEIAGTPETMAPEIIEGRPAGVASDLYALCAVGIFLLSGRPVFDADSVEDLLQQHLEATPQSLAERGVKVPEDLESVLLRGLAKDPRERYAHALELRAALHSCADATLWSAVARERWWQVHGPQLLRQVAPVEDVAPEAAARTVLLRRG